MNGYKVIRFQLALIKKENKKEWIPAGVYPRQSGGGNDKKNSVFIRVYPWFTVSAVFAFTDYCKLTTDYFIFFTDS